MSTPSSTVSATVRILTDARASLNQAIGRLDAAWQHDPGPMTRAQYLAARQALARAVDLLNLG